MLRLVVILLGLWLAFIPLGAAAEGDIDIKSRGETVRILVTSPKKVKPVAVAVLFAGGGGVLNIKKSPFGAVIKNLSNNFLLRSSKYFRNNGFVTVAIDAPTDQSSDLFGFRDTEDHAKDVAAVIAYLRKEFGLPVWLVGTSRGTNSVANAAIRLQGPKGPNGIVLTATMLDFKHGGDPDYWTNVLDMNLDEITVPVVIAHHKQDRCSKTPPGKVKDMVEDLEKAKIIAVLWYDGGEPKGPDCEAFHYHGFPGQEERVVNDIAAAIKKTL